MEKGFYHSSRSYWQTNSDVSDDILATYPDGTIEVALQPSRLHTFNGTEWVAPTQAELDAEVARGVRAERDYRLTNEVDPIAGNALRWAALTSADREAWADYREALLNLTDQAGFPNTVTWPTKPEGN